MRIPPKPFSLIDDPHVVRRILNHLGRWAPEPAGPGPPAPQLRRGERESGHLT